MSRHGSFGRRRIGLVGAGLLAGIPPRPARAVRGSAEGGSAVPCPARDGDVVGLVLEGPSPAGVAVLGQPLRPGDLPASATLAARRANGGPLRAQTDVTVRHDDGSARHVVLALDVPALGRGERLGLLLSRTSAAPAAPLDVAALAAGRQAQVEIAPAGGTPWRADLLRAATRATERPWQTGALVVSRRVSFPVPPEAAGGATSLRLVADVALRADGTLWVDAWFRNDVAMRAGGGTAAYTARILLDGREALRADLPTHHQYRGWGRLLGAGTGGRMTGAPHVRHDAAYLADSGATARYDLATGVGEELLARMGRAVAEPGWSAPLGTRGIVPYMPTGGGRFDIGPTTGWQAAWLVSGDARAAAYCIGQAEAAGTIPWHFWDPAGGADGTGGWLDAIRWPNLWTDPRGGQPPRGLAQPVPTDTGWTTDSSHQPTLAFVPYLLTGRRALADEVMATGAWNVVGKWPAMRARPEGPRGEEGFLVVNRQQARGAAWSLRALDEAAWIAPDGDPNTPYLRDVAARNFAWLRARIPEWTALQGEAHGWLPPYELGSRGVSLAPWQQDYVALAVIAAARRGREDARVFLSWMTNFLVGRFEAEARGFPRRDGVAYQMAIGRGGPGIEPHRTWREVGNAMRAAGTSNGEGWSKSNGDYASLALASLAGIADVLDHAGARRAHSWLGEAGAPFTAAANRRRDSTLSIVPRGPDSAGRCGTRPATRRG